MQALTTQPAVTRDVPMPGEGIDQDKMPGHWLLARLGKRVLRPGGLAMTRRMLGSLRLMRGDHIVEFAPGLGITARMALWAQPATYTAVERDERAAAQVQRVLAGVSTTSCRIVTGVAQETNLPDQSATVVYGEAMLTMQPDTVKRRIVREALRLLRPGGRYGIHEMCLDCQDPSQAQAIRRGLTSAIHHQALPLTIADWRALLESEGFEVVEHFTAPMALLEPGRLVRDEGVFGAMRFLWRLARDRKARTRVAEMRRVFRARRRDMAAVCFVVRKPVKERST